MALAGDDSCEHIVKFEEAKTEGGKAIDDRTGRSRGVCLCALFGKCENAQPRVAL